MHNVTNQVVGTRGAPSSAFQTAVASAAQKQKFSFFRGTDGILYIDNAGSKLMAETETEIDIMNFLGFPLKWKREFRVDGVSVSTVTHVTNITNVAVVGAPPDQEMERAGNINQLRELKQLVDEGVLTQEEFEKKKEDILQTL